MITVEYLRSIMPFSAGGSSTFALVLGLAMDEFDIVSAKRRAAFLAQCAHESGELRYLRELGNGAAYEGRVDLGNDQPGDGARFKGGGLLQITGRANYTKCGEALGVSLANTPTLIETPGIASRSAAWFWKQRGLNALADTDAFGSITHAINGGYNGLDARLRYWLAARKAEGL